VTFRVRSLVDALFKPAFSNESVTAFDFAALTRHVKDGVASAAVRQFRVAGRFAARSDWHSDLGVFERAVDRDARLIAFDDQGEAGQEGEARRPIGEQGGCQARGR
jgi:hypothetical protein